MNSPARLLVLTAVIFLGAFGALAQAGKYKLSVRFGSYLVSNKEQFEFSVAGERLAINTANPVALFGKRFSTGDSYRITQVSGPRQCNFWGLDSGVFAEQDILVSVDCGYPPLTLFKLQITGVQQGEIFKFADNYGRLYQYPFSTTGNLGGYPQGDDYAVSQTDGPRPCRMTLNQGVVPAAPVTVKAECGAADATPPPATSNGAFKDFELVSRSTDDKKFGSFYDSTAVVIGGTGADEGRYVAFVSYAPGLGGASGRKRQIIWRDRKTGESVLISATAQNGEGNGDSFAPAISADGRSVAFESYATNLVPVDTNGVRDVFVWNYDRRTISAVSDAPGNIEANAEAYEPSISGDGRYIAFSSSASTLTPGVDGTSTVNVFLKDMQTGSVTLISRDEKTKKAGGGSRPSISDDGSRIAFYNYFPLTTEDKNNLWDIYVWQSGMPKLKRVTKTDSGAEKDQGDESSSRVVAPTISGDGRYVAFSTTATNMVPGDPAKLQDAFLAEVDSGRIIHLSPAAGGGFGDGDSPFGQGERIALTNDGRQALFNTKAKNLGGGLVIASTTEGVVVKGILPLTFDGVTASVGTPAISATGKCVAFGSNIKLDKRFPSSGIFVTCR